MPLAAQVETVRKVDEAIVFAVDVSSRMRAGLTTGHHRILEKVSLLAGERNSYLKRWQRNYVGNVNYVPRKRGIQIGLFVDDTTIFTSDANKTNIRLQR